MKFRKAMAVALAAAISLFCGTGVSAATAESGKTPDILFYRAKARDTFEGEISLPAGKGAITSVKLSQEGTPSMVISGFEGTTAWFDSLYRSTEQTLIIVRDGKETEVPVSLAVYDSVTLTPEQGSVTLTVKNSKTLKPVPGAEYSLYRGSKRMEDGLVSDSSGRITVKGLEPGNYELRPGGSVNGFQAAEITIPFEIGGLELSGGEQSIRTSAGKKISAEENEILIAGDFSQDVNLSASKEDQITSVTVTYMNSGAELEKAGKAEETTFATAKEAAEDINSRKADGLITGPVEVSYTLKSTPGKSTCNFTQYLEAKPTVAPTPSPNGNNNSQGGNGSNQNQVNQPTPTPAPTVKPVTTPAPVIQPTENLTIASFADNGKLDGFVYRLEGTTVDGNNYVKEYKSDEAGEINVIVPAGVYIVAPKDCTANKGFELPQGQSVQLTATGKSYLSFAFVSTERPLSLTVTDDDGVPLEGVTVGIFPSELLAQAGEVREDPEAPANGVTDVSQQISDLQAQEDREALLADPFAKKNALKTGKTDAMGVVELEGLPVTELLAVPIDTPAGYTMEKTATEIPAGLQTQADVTCEYIKVDVEVVNKESKAPVKGVEAVLLDSAGNELTRWKTDGKKQSFIRVPQGKYSLQLTYGEQSETLDYEVVSEKTRQDFTLETDLTGIVDETTPQPERKTNLLVLMFAGVIGAALLTVGGVYAYRRFRKKGNGLS